MRIMGVDPGVTGAWALIVDRQLTHVDDLVVTSIGSTNQIDAGEFREVLRWTQPDAVVIEDNRANGVNGSKANYSMGLSMGIILGVATGAGFSIGRVRPVDWQRTVGLSGVPAAQRKDAHRARARELWPDEADRFKLKKDHNRADAALIAEHWRRT